MNAPLYQGEAPTISRVPLAQISTTNPMQQTWNQNAARATQNAYALEDAIVDRIEYASEQELEYQQQQLNADLKNQLEQKLALANGAPGALFDKSGLPNEAAIKNLVAPFNARIANWSRAFITPHSKQQATLAQQQASAGFTNTIRASLTASLKPRAISAFRQNYDLAIATGKTEDAIAAARNLYERGFASPQELALYEIDAMEKGVSYQLNHISSFAEADKLINNPAFFGSCTTNQQQYLRNLRKYLSARETPPAVILKSGSKAGSTNPQDYTKTAPLAPAGLPWFMEDIYDTAGGDFSEKNPNARALAAQNLVRWAAHAINPEAPYNTEDEAVFRVQAKAFGQSEGAVSAALEEARKGLSDTTALNITSAINELNASALLPSMTAGRIKNYAQQHYTDNKYKDLDEKEAKAAAGRDLYEAYLRLEISQEEAQRFLDSGLSPMEYHNAMANARRDLISAEYSAWLSISGNTRADYETKLGHLNKIITKYTNAKTLPHAQKAMQPYLDIARQQELERIANVKAVKHQQTIDNAITQGRAYARRDLAAHPATPEFAQLTYAPEKTATLPNTEQAAIVYVPKGYTKLGKPGSAQLVNPATGKINKIDIMEVDDIDHPHLSSCLYQHCLIFDYETPPTLNISLHQGKLFITRKYQDSPSSEEQAPTPTYGEVSQNNQRLPAWAESQMVDDTTEEATPVSYAYPTGDLPI
ncbi:MAG: hypothetical protein IKZ07_07295 [Akkermansia sp.]|nr:hypothetical protein [Akkermansia sp.]